MIKRIPTNELVVGMFIHDLDCGWMEHPFMHNNFTVTNQDIIKKIIDAGIRYVYINTKLGKDLASAPTPEQIDHNLQEKAGSIVNDQVLAGRQVSIDEEYNRAKKLYTEATSIVRNLMSDARLGKAVEIETINPLAERMVQSAFRNQYALTAIARIKTKDDYTFMHCVSFAGLMIAFARNQGFNDQLIHEVAIGSLIHDIGKTMIPDEVLNKPGKLTPEEFEVMKKHVDYSGEILQDTLGISQNSLDVAMLHHERMDGTGYPLGLSGNQISLIGKMSAIVDVYDALTSVRVYKDAWEPTNTLKKMLEWSPHHFSRELVECFIRCLGIYPVGSVVELESGLVGIVMDQGNDLLRPKLKVVYNSKHHHYVPIRELELSKTASDRIISAISPGKYGLDISAFI